VLDRVVALEEFERRGRTDSEIGPLNVSTARFTLRVRDQLARVLRDDLSGSGTEKQAAREDDSAVLRCVFAAFPDRLARRRGPGSRAAVIAGGRGVRLSERSGVIAAELFVCVDVEADKSESFVRLASAVEREWLDPDRMASEDQCEFDETAERVVAVRRRSWDGLVLDEAPVALPSEQEVAAALAAAAAGRLDRVLPRDDAFSVFLARVRSLREWMPQLELPAFDDDQLRAVLPYLCLGRRSFAELRQAPWTDFLQGRLTHAQRQALDREAPERVPVPSGSRIALRYEPGRSPVLAVRIQELFGLAETPRIAGGCVPVLLHLLAPNMRPQQVTDDLQSFWTNTYPKIRSELRRRYPKHAWPEDPWTAEPQRRPGGKMARQ
jgi:ATP-dependent helicase HrpB